MKKAVLALLTLLLVCLISAASADYGWPFSVTNVKVFSNSSYTVCTGSVTNNSTTTYRFVKVLGSFTNSWGSQVDSDWTYAVGGEGLAPGESSTFRLSVKKNGSISSCSVTVYDYDAASSTYHTKVRNGASLFTISNVKVYSSYGSMYCTGTIRNNSSRTVKFVKVKGAFTDWRGNVIDTDDTYAVGSEGLAPGKTTTFKMYVDENYSIQNCTVTVYDYD